MALTKRPASTMKPTVDPAAADRFISGAPDAAPAAAVTAPQAIRSNVFRGKQVQVSLAMPPELLVKVDQAADQLRISRAAYVKQALVRAIKSEENK